MGNIFFSEFKSPCFKTKGAKTLGSSVNFDDGLDVTRGEGAKQRGWRQYLVFVSVSRKTMDKESPQNLIFTLRPGQVFQTEEHSLSNQHIVLSQEMLERAFSSYRLQTPWVSVNRESPGETNLYCLHCHHNNISGLQEGQGGEAGRKCLFRWKIQKPAGGRGRGTMRE